MRILFRSVLSVKSKIINTFFLYDTEYVCSLNFSSGGNSVKEFNNLENVLATTDIISIINLHFKD